MSSGVPFLDETMWRAKRTREPVGASEFGGAPGPDPHAHADPPPSHRGYRAGPLGGGRYMPIMPPASVSDRIAIFMRPPTAASSGEVGKPA